MTPDRVELSPAVHAQARADRLRDGAARQRQQRLAPGRRRAAGSGVRTRLAGSLRHLADRLEPRRDTRRVGGLTRA
jgi:hypothetical protein